MTNRPKRGNTNIGKDGVRNPGRFASNMTNVGEPDDRLAQIGTDDWLRQRFLGMNDDTDLTVPETKSLIQQEIVDHLSYHGIEDYSCDIQENKIVFYSIPIEKTGGATSYTEHAPDEWLDMSDPDYRDWIESDPEQFEMEVRSAKWELAVKAADGIRLAVEKELMDRKVAEWQRNNPEG